MVAASGFTRQQTPFSAKSSIYWRQSHRFLSKTPLKTGVKPQKQPLQLSDKKRFSQKYCKFYRKTPVLTSLFNTVAGQFEDCEQSELNILNPQPEVYFQPGQTSTMELFLRKQLTLDTAIIRSSRLQKWCSYEILQNSQENTCVRVLFLMKLQIYRV